MPRDLAMLKHARQLIVEQLYKQHRTDTPHLSIIENALSKKGTLKHYFDHFAIIDLPSSKSGIPTLTQLFSALGFIVSGQDYLPDKQNDFCWLTEENQTLLPAKQTLPQIVVADFRLDEMPLEIKTIIEKYVSQTKEPPVLNKHQDFSCFIHQLNSYFRGRDWPLPTVKEFLCVQEFNDLLAWVLVFGRKPNHFTFSVHLMEHFNNLNDFNQFILNETKLILNEDGGIIKGGESSGIAQSSTTGTLETMALYDGKIKIPTGFVEFVWRYPTSANIHPEQPLWRDFYTGFVANHANHVIESLTANAGSY